MKSRQASLTKSLIRLTLLPLVAFGVIVLMVSSYVVYTGIEREIKDNLTAIAKSTYRIYELLYPGDYYRDGQGALYKGGIPLNDCYDMLDKAGVEAEVDLTLFYGDTRVLTSIRDQGGRRIVRTEAAPEVVQVVLEQGEQYFSDHIAISGKLYFGYYMPVTNSDGAVVGMMFAGRPWEEVMPTIGQNILGIFVPALIVMLAAGAVSVIFGRRIVLALGAIKDFLQSIAGGDLKARLDDTLLLRQDEIGEMGRFAIVLQDSITELVGTDPLTGLYNRRSGGIVLEETFKNYKRRSMPFVLAIGDIDLFKEVNDRYGHQAGDTALKEIALLLREHMEHKGFVFRFGGEEFLFIYEDAPLAAVLADLQELKEKISRREIAADQACFHVAMTFGVADCQDGADIETLIRLADDSLYYGKNHGRNVVVHQRRCQ